MVSPSSFEIDVDDAPSAPDVAFEDVHREAVERLGPAFALAIDDRRLAARGLTHALERSTRQRVPAEPVIWAMAFEATTSARWPRPAPQPIGPEVVDRASAGLHAAIKELPVRQRSALVIEHVLGWDDIANARAHRTAVSTIELRRSRALDALGKAVDEPLDEEVLRRELRSLIPSALDLGEPDELRTRARRRRRLFAAAIAGIGLALIAGIGVLLRPAPVVEVDEVVDRELVDPPRETQQPYTPIGDGRGGFAALTRQGGRIVTSDDGVEWVQASRLNVDRIDLRLFVDRFYRSGGYFLALIDSESGGGGATDAPRIALSRDLEDWRILRLDLEPPDLPRGLRASVDLVSAAVVDERVVIALRMVPEIEYHRLGLSRSRVCAQVEEDEGLVLHTCDGREIVLGDAIDWQVFGARLFASEAGATFVELTPDADVNAFGLFVLDGQFAMLGEATDLVLVSDDAETWRPLLDLGNRNRLGLVQPADGPGSAESDGAVIVSPSTLGWRSSRLEGERITTSELPIDVDPTTIWVRPELASGPAGWAMFLTTSRPWERGAESVAGWAVHIDDWIIEHRPELESIRLRSTTRTLTYEFGGVIADGDVATGHPHVVRSQFGGVRLFDPVTGELLVEVSGERIRASWVTGVNADLGGEREAAPIGTIEQEGWTLTGNIRTGPLTLNGPDDRARTFVDGFAFTNGSVDDGVESTVLGSGRGTLDFFDGGELLVSFAEEELVPALDAPAERSAGGATKAMVVFSPDGVEWQEIWRTSADTWYGGVAVGDDEVLVSATGFGEPERIPVGQSDP
ncbi:MAG: hypothetical protein AAF567_07020 [Actinomycetota bacterium]